jgi:hypothetical protein
MYLFIYPSIHAGELSSAANNARDPTMNAHTHSSWGLNIHIYRYARYTRCLLYVEKRKRKETWSNFFFSREATRAAPLKKLHAKSVQWHTSPIHTHTHTHDPFWKYIYRWNSMRWSYSSIGSAFWMTKKAAARVARSVLRLRLYCVCDAHSASK